MSHHYWFWVFLFICGYGLGMCIGAALSTTKEVKIHAYQTPIRTEIIKTNSGIIDTIYVYKLK